MEDWFHQMSNPREIKNLLTYRTCHNKHTLRSFPAVKDVHKRTLPGRNMTILLPLECLDLRKFYMIIEQFTLCVFA